MDFLNPKKKRAHQIRLFIGYALMAVLIGFATLILVYMTYGYNIDRHTGQVVQEGLVFLSAHPEGAEVAINGENKGKTDTGLGLAAARLGLAAGKYQINLSRNGYLPWQHALTLEGGSIEQLVYPFLFPEKLQSKDVQLYAALPSFASVSHDRHWLVVQTGAAPNSLVSYDITTPQSPGLPLVLPTELLGDSSGKLEVVEWSSDNRHMLVRYSAEQKTSYVLIDRQSPAESINLSQVFSLPDVDFALRDKKADQLYVYNRTDGSLKQADLKIKTLTPLLDHVVAYYPYGADKIMYVTTDGAASDHVLVKIMEGAKSYNFRQIPAATHYYLNMAQFSGHWYMTFGNSTEQQAYILRDPLNTLKRDQTQLPRAFALLRVKNITSLSVSENSRFLALQGGSSFAVYDLETNRQYRYDTKLTVDEAQKASWMDGHRLSMVSDDKVRVFDFDGTNLKTLAGASVNFRPFFDRDYTALFTLGPSAAVPNGSALVRTPLRANQKQ